MRISKLALLAIKGMRAEGIGKLATALNTSDKTIYRYIKNNDDNLTKAAALAVIREETGMDDSQILEEEKEVA